MSINLLTVVFSPEVPLLKIQAQSVDLYVDNVGEILVIVNDDVTANIDTAWWGRYQHRVCIKHYSDYGITQMSSGWDQQQCCKLMGAATFRDPVLILDAKTWFVQRVEHDLLFDKQGRARFRPIPIPEVFQDGWRFLCDCFGEHKDPVMVGPGGVPFVMFPDIVKNLIDHVELHNDSNFVDWFCQHVMYPDFITEFNLYSFYLCYRYGSYDLFYSDDQHYCAVNVAPWQETEIDTLLEEMKDYKTLTVSIHRDAQDKLPREKMESWKSWLRDEKRLNT
jgi:hypothetical protein